MERVETESQNQLVVMGRFRPGSSGSSDLLRGSFRCWFEPSVVVSH